LKAGPPPVLTDGLQRCGEQHAPSGARVSVQFAVGSAGCVEQVRVRATQSAPALEGCVAELFGALRFDAPVSGGVEVVRFPVTLAPRREPDASR
jgi:outer membrane biosynthesis protein TonB